MLRRLAVVLTGLLATGFLTAGPAVASPADGHRLTAKEREGLRAAGEVLDALFGGPGPSDRY
ncbi:hypothetical protein [Streptomyces kronopolitis]|uniref:hypothetical protein n=1 Tax=Streptomyces kronopolitis TaxID=1612435 RepID=UPI0020BE4FC2|nr:hypothetical protein [Streptomyces kronopolitis]MCL6298953.1 hypothetical protein [Streptomyces kronopolitis]